MTNVSLFASSLTHSTSNSHFSFIPPVDDLFTQLATLNSFQLVLGGVRMVARSFQFSPAFPWSSTFKVLFSVALKTRLFGLMKTPKVGETAFASHHLRLVPAALNSDSPL